MDEPTGPAAETAPGRRHHRAQGEPMVTSEDFELLRPEWEAMHRSVLGATPFTHPAWHETWLRHFGDAAQPVFLSIRVDEALVGVAALDMARDMAATLGDPNVRDYGGPLCAQGFENHVARGLLEWLDEDLTGRANLWGLVERDAMAEAFVAAADALGWRSEVVAEAVCPAMALPDDFEGYLASLAKHERHETRRKLRNLAAAGEVTFSSETEAAGIAAAMPEFLGLMRASGGGKAEFLTPRMEAFFEELGPAMAAAGLARMSRLRLDGATVAMVLAFENRDGVMLYNSGYDPEYAHLAVGLLSKVYAVRESIERGKREFDFLRGDETYKHALGGVGRRIITVRLARSRTEPRP